MLRSFHILFSFLYCITVLFPQSASAVQANAYFNELTTILSKNDLLLFASLKNSVNKEMKEALQSGIPLKFSFTLQLLRPAVGKESELLFTHSFNHTISFNTLTNEYAVSYNNYNGKSSHSLSYADLQSALNALNSINGMTVVPIGQLLPGNIYRLRIKAELFHKTLPPSFSRLLPFLSWDDRKVKWQEVNFRY